MVALNENFAPAKPAPGSKNRVGNFFGQEGESSRANRLPAQSTRRENGCGYDATASGMFFYGFRYYDPETGRWPSRDPLGEYGGLNMYAMVSNNALSWIDFLGLASCSELAADLAKLAKEMAANNASLADWEAAKAQMIADRAALMLTSKNLQKNFDSANIALGKATAALVFAFTGGLIPAVKGYQALAAASTGVGTLFGLDSYNSALGNYNTAAAALKGYSDQINGYFLAIDAAVKQINLLNNNISDQSDAIDSINSQMEAQCCE